MFTKEEFTKAFIEGLKEAGVETKSGTLEDSIPELVEELDKNDGINYNDELESQVNENVSMFVVALMLRGGIGG